MENQHSSVILSVISLLQSLVDVLPEDGLREMLTLFKVTPWQKWQSLGVDTSLVLDLFQQVLDTCLSSKSAKTLPVSAFYNPTAKHPLKSKSSLVCAMCPAAPLTIG
jgi:hypothetical protein